jgi:hypothetical protein
MNALRPVSAGLLLFAAVGCSGGGTARDGKPARLPALASIGLYATSSPFNQAIAADAEVDPASDTLVGSLVAAGTMVIQVRQYSAPVYFAGPDTPRRDVRLACGPDWELGVTVLADVPIPNFAEPGFDADGQSPPVGCGTESDMDNNMVIFDLERRCEWDFWQVRRDGGGWVASWGNGTSLDGSGVYPKGLSTRGSGFAFPGGVIWPDELADGEIRHALAFSYSYTRVGGPVAPAVDSDGVTNAPDAIPEGALVQLDPALDLDALGLTPTERTVARALQVYGMYLVDTGGEAGIGLYAVDPRSVSQDPYAAILAPDEAFLALDGMPIESLRVLRLGPQNPDFAARLAVEGNPCASFR